MAMLYTKYSKFNVALQTIIKLSVWDGSLSAGQCAGVLEAQKKRLLFSKLYGTCEKELL